MTDPPGPEPPREGGRRAAATRPSQPLPFSRPIRVGSQPEPKKRYPVTPWSEQRLYRPFVKWALIIGLTLGSATGAGMVLGRAFGLEIGIWWLTHAQSHGMAQIFGFAGLFTMGVAFHVVPRFRNAALRFPWPQRATLWLVAGSTVARFAGQSINATAVSSPLLVISGVMLLAGVAVFAATLGPVLLRGRTARGPAERWIAAGLAWALIAAGLHMAVTLRMAADSTTLAYGPWNRALITAGLTGFISCILFGVSTRAVTGFLGLRPIFRRAEVSAFVVFNAGVAWWTFAQFVEAGGAAAASGPLLVAFGAALFVISLRVLEPSQTPRPPLPGAYPRYARFIRAGYMWLIVFCVLIALESIDSVADTSFLPAGSSRPAVHALTLGFITSLIFGMGCRMLPLFEGAVIERHRWLDAAWWLLMAGVTLRVVFGFVRPWANGMLGLSGTLALLALAAFIWALWSAFSQRARDSYAQQAREIGRVRWAERGG